MKKWIRSFFDLFFPKICIYCGAPLVEGEEYICCECILQLPRTNFYQKEGNLAEQLFWGKVQFCKIASYLYFYKRGITQKIIHSLKYKGEKRLGATMGKLMSNEMINSAFFEGIDLILPIPLHDNKLKKRGYNQSEWIAKGISDVTGIPICADVLYRTIETSSQTNQSVYDRWMNTRNTFGIKDISQLKDKHILLVDDVLTTGATLVACIETIEKQTSCKISILTLAFTSKCL